MELADLGTLIATYPQSTDILTAQQHIDDINGPRTFHPLICP